MSHIRAIHGDCRDVLRSLATNSVDCIITDPPYGLGTIKSLPHLIGAWLQGEEGYEYYGSSGFMGKEWDAGIPPPSLWRECFRVLKPGGHLACFSGTRMQDLMGLSLRLGGFALRDTIAIEGTLQWVHANGMSKSVEKYHPVTGERLYVDLVPSHDTILLVRKEFPEATVVENVALWGTGAMWADRVAIAIPLSDTSRTAKNSLFLHHPACKEDGYSYKKAGKGLLEDSMIRRNTYGNDTVRKAYKGKGVDGLEAIQMWECHPDCCVLPLQLQEKSHFFQHFSWSDTEKTYHFSAKASPKERHAGLQKNNSHISVKPISPLRWLIRLLCPEHGVVFDPFAGTMTTGIAALQEERGAICVERETIHAHEGLMRLIHYASEVDSIRREV